MSLSTKGNNGIGNVTLSSSSSDTRTSTPVKCVPCSTLDKSHIIDIETLQKRTLIELPLWTLVPKQSLTTTTKTTSSNNNNNNNEVHYYALCRSYTATNFQSALDSINAMGIIAEQENHHPDFHLTNYRDVTIELFTHVLNGITENDISLAKLLDTNVRIEYSPKWLKNNPHAISTSK